MKKSILIITIIMLLIGATTVFAAEPTATIEGASTVGVGQNQKVTIKIKSDKLVGVVSGKIGVAGDVTIKSVSGNNGWNLTYNNNTGAFNVIKAEGAKEEQVMEIEYTAANKEGTGTIKVDEVNLTTTEDYETIEVGTISKTIQIIKENADQPEDKEEQENQEDQENQEEKVLSKIEIAKNPIKTTYIKGQKFDKTGMTIIAKYTDGSSKEVTNYTYNPTGNLKATDKKVTISYTEDGVTKTVTIDITVKEETSAGTGNVSAGGTSTGSGSKDKTVSKNDISKAGLETIIVPIVIVGIFAIVGLVGYKKYNKV